MATFQKHLDQLFYYRVVPAWFLDHLVRSFDDEKVIPVRDVAKWGSVSVSDIMDLLVKQFSEPQDYSGDVISRDTLKTLLIILKRRGHHTKVIAVEREHRKWMELQLQRAQAKLTSKYEPGERVYVARNDVYLDDNPIYKVGKTKDLSKRLQNYNTSSLDGFVIVFERKCIDSKVVESVVHFVLESSRCDRAREYFYGPLKRIVNVINRIADTIDGMKKEMCSPNSEDYEELSETLEIPEPPPVEEVVKEVSPYFQPKGLANLEKYRYNFTPNPTHTPKPNPHPNRPLRIG